MTRTVQFAENNKMLLEGALKYGRRTETDGARGLIEAYERIIAATDPEAQLELEINSDNYYMAYHIRRDLFERPGRLVPQAVVDSYFKF